MTKKIQFPSNFLWGSATSAYQIEGSPLVDGAGESIWTRFAKTPGSVANGDTGDVACDHYQRYKSDVGLMKQLGLQAYRFSVSWSRVLPQGTGGVNQAGLDFYKNLVDELLANDIEPLATLYHWDLPAALDDRGGWLNPEIADWFADYAEVMYQALDGKVKKWATINEPWVVVDGGYTHGVMAPGHKSLVETPIAVHNIMRAHGAAVKRYRAVGQHEIGLVVNIEPKYPASQSEADLAATKRADVHMNKQYIEPAIHGRYPQGLAEIYGDAWQEWPEEDLQLISQPIDFVGLNYYTRNVTQHDEKAHWLLQAAPIKQPGATYTETGWEVYEQGLIDTLVWIKELYGNPPIYITENGAAFYDPPKAAEGRIHDPLRVSYLHSHIKAVHSAIELGVDVRGYMLWSLFDNLEWALGFSKRFGIIHIDFETLQRTFKDSGMFYSKVIETNGAVLNQSPEYCLNELSSERDHCG